MRSLYSQLWLPSSRRSFYAQWLVFECMRKPLQSWGKIRLLCSYSSTLAGFLLNHRLMDKEIPIERAGLEPTFSAHSTRSAASTAAALSGLSAQKVMDRAGWSSLDIFCRYYFTPQSEFCTAKRFGDAVLGYKHAQDMLIEPGPPEVQSTNG